MSDLVLASGREISRDLSSVAANARLGRVATVASDSEPDTRAPRQEWLGPASQGNNSPADRQDTGEFAAMRLVGHKVLAQGAGRSSASPTVKALAPGSLVPVSGGAYATRAIASFSQQLADYGMAKGTRIDTYA